MPTFVEGLRFWRSARKHLTYTDLRQVRQRMRLHANRGRLSFMSFLTVCPNSYEGGPDHAHGVKPKLYLQNAGSVYYAMEGNYKTKKLALCRFCGVCPECCKCFKCRSCLRTGTQDSRCTRSTQGILPVCQRCCACVKCVRCGLHAADWRGTSTAPHGCGNCPDCCRCGRQIEFFGSKLHFHSATRAQRLQNRSARFISAEIEIAGVKTNAATISQKVKEWKGSIVADGSLPDMGFEINTAPAAGDLFLREINEICQELTKGAADVTKSCGCHVHIDARDFSYYDLRRLIYYYETIEPILFAMVPRDRRENQYCRPSGERFVRALKVGRFDLKSIKTSVMDATYGEGRAKDVHNLRKDKYGGERYLALNIGSWFYRGTVECRLHEGTADATEIQNWGMLWAHILDYVLRSTDEQIQTMRLAHALPYRVFRTEPKTELILRYHALQSAVIKNERLLQYIKNRIQSFYYDSAPTIALRDAIEAADSLYITPNVTSTPITLP